MASYSTREFEVSLERKGFKREKTHHQMFWFYYCGKRTSIRTRTSFNEKEFDEGILDQRKKQLKLTKRQFIEFLECPLNGSGYAKKLIRNGHIRLNYNK